MEIKKLSNSLQKLRCIQQRLTKEFELSTGFSLTRYEILSFLDEKEKCLQNEIADHLEIDPAAITRQLKILEEDGFVTRDRNKDNAREVIVSLTDYAKKELQACKDKHKNRKTDVAISIGKQDMDKLIKILSHIEESFQ
ncbi:MarR family winged helix-turn-helix transcriptional regulator [Anaerococcus sp. Marseille-Q5996]|uniref:MarR family winged helix-turn-helix transcriptional regulator n=1 Tax=Anaerococcus sp. Marseille-Q5996 TaxID=2972769 RepID=UPI0021C623D6|nr:MarR family transcriptional regulator [Anaerococcus sp. Marseille-Q5996]